MLKVIAASLVALGMVPAYALDPAFAAFMQTTVGNQTTVGFAAGGTPLANSAPPSGTAALGGMGYTKTAEGVFMESIGSTRVPGTTKTVPVSSKLKLSAGVLAKGFAKAVPLYAAWETGSALYDVWTDFGLSYSNGVVSKPALGVTSATGKTYYVSDTNTWAFSATQACKNAGAQWGWIYKSNTETSCYLNRGYGSDLGYGIAVWTTAPPNKTCALGKYVFNGACYTTPPVSALTNAQLEQELLDKINAGGYLPAIQGYVDALKLDGVQQEVKPMLAALPPANYEVKVGGSTTATIGDPVQVVSNDGTKTTTTTTTTTASTAGNVITYNTTNVTNITDNSTGATISNVTTTAPKAKSSDTQNPIDEEGTPQADPDQVYKDKATTALADLTSCINNITSCTPELPSLNWSFSLPSHCSPISLGTAYADAAPSLGSIDVCQFQPTIHDIMSILWAAAGLFGAVGMVFRDAAGS